jgi:GNAT superfamily N-acetyltransferase
MSPDAIKSRLKLRLTVRQAVLGDVEALLPLFEDNRQFRGHEAAPQASRVFLQERIGRNETVVFLAHEGDALIGFTQMYLTYSSLLLAPVFLIDELWVLAPYRKLGVGTELEAAAIEYATAAGAVRLSMSTSTGDAVPQSVYAAAGWMRSHNHVYHFFP